MNDYLIEKYHASSRKLVLLDYDGTLLDYAPQPDKAVPSRQLIQLLHNLHAKSGNQLALVSGRGADSLDQLFAIQPFEIFAEHGALLKQHDQWIKLVPDNTAWKQPVLELIHALTGNCRRAHTEEKHFTLSWHYRNCQRSEGQYFSRLLLNELIAVSERYALQILDGNKVIEIRDQQISKANAVGYYLNKNNYDFILCIGDDLTDEDMFGALKENEQAHTIKVGKGSTVAKQRVDSYKEVLDILFQLQ